MVRFIIYLIVFFFYSTVLFGKANGSPDSVLISSWENKRGNDLFFIENKGQFKDMDGKAASFILFKAQTRGLDIYVTERGLSYVFIEAKKEKKKSVNSLAQHSFKAVRLITEYYKCFNIKLELKDTFSYTSLESHALLVENLKNENSKIIKLKSQHLVLLQKGAGQKTFFIVPGQEGISDGYVDLANSLSEQGSAYGFQMQGLFENEEPMDNIVEIAAKNIEWIKMVQSSGPYYIIGHSFGAMVAFEMAKQLEKNNETIELLALLDRSPINQPIEKFKKKDYVIDILTDLVEKSKLINNENLKWFNDLRLSITEMDQKNIGPYILNSLSEKFPNNKEEIEMFIKLFSISISNIEAMNSYSVSGKIFAKTIEFVAEDSEGADVEGNLEWNDYILDVKTIVAQGNHFSMIKKENAKFLANEIETNMFSNQEKTESVLL